MKNNDEIRMALDEDAGALDNIPEYHSPFFLLIYVFNSSFSYQCLVRNNGRLAIRWSDADHDLKSVQSITKLPGR
ncbi:MAG TPA: hypothetical protein VFR94_24705 [Nitrososphaeraceae archaeon]|nr:hypothetical protein [Nitrososphaeraceae archaeon]